MLPKHAFWLITCFMVLFFFGGRSSPKACRLMKRMINSAGGGTVWQRYAALDAVRRWMETQSTSRNYQESVDLTPSLPFFPSNLLSPVEVAGQLTDGYGAVSPSWAEVWQVHSLKFRGGFDHSAGWRKMS